jgi:hypothetical protein
VSIRHERRGGLLAEQCRQNSDGLVSPFAPCPPHLKADANHPRCISLSSKGRSRRDVREQGSTRAARRISARQIPCREICSRECLGRSVECDAWAMQESLPLAEKPSKGRASQRFLASALAGHWGFRIGADCNRLPLNNGSEMATSSRGGRNGPSHSILARPSLPTAHCGSSGNEQEIPRGCSALLWTHNRHRVWPPSAVTDRSIAARTMGVGLTIEASTIDPSRKKFSVSGSRPPAPERIVPSPRGRGGLGLTIDPGVLRTHHPPRLEERDSAKGRWGWG